VYYLIVFREQGEPVPGKQRVFFVNDDGDRVDGTFCEDAFYAPKSGDTIPSSVALLKIGVLRQDDAGCRSLVSIDSQDPSVPPATWVSSSKLVKGAAGIRIY